VRPSALSLMVALQGTPSTAAPWVCASEMTADISGIVTSGLALSCMATCVQGVVVVVVVDVVSSMTLARPFSTEPWRSIPGLAKASFPWYLSTMGW